VGGPVDHWGLWEPVTMTTGPMWHDAPVESTGSETMAGGKPSRGRHPPVVHRAGGRDRIGHWPTGIERPKKIHRCTHAGRRAPRRCAPNDGASDRSVSVRRQRVHRSTREHHGACLW